MAPATDENALVLPQLLNAGLAANDRLKYYRTLLRMAAATARSHSRSRPLPEPQEMSALALGMLRDALRAFENEEAAIARAVIERDDALDVINARVMGDILDNRCVDQETVTACISALVARSRERVGDYGTNICEESFTWSGARTCVIPRDCEGKSRRPRNFRPLCVP